MFFIVFIIVIALVLIYRIYKKGNTLKQENSEYVSNLQELQEKRKKQYEKGRDIQCRLGKAVEDFNTQSDRLFNLRSAVCKFEKEHYKDIIQDKNYEKKLGLYKVICENGVSKENKSKRRFKSRRKQYLAKNVNKCLKKQRKKSVFIPENIEQDFIYKESESRGEIMFDTLMRWTAIIFGGCAVIITLVSNPLILLFILVFIIACGICWALDEAFSLDIAIILPIIAGVLTIGSFIITLVANLGLILSGFAVVYFSAGLWGIIYYSFFLYNKSVLKERNRIKLRIKNAETKINEWEKGDRCSDVQELEYLVEVIQENLDGVNLSFSKYEQTTTKDSNSVTEDSSMEEMVEGYWDWLVLGNGFLNGLNGSDNGLNMEFVKKFYKDLAKFATEENE